MEKNPARLLAAALQLPEEARAALVASLLQSLENDVDSDAEAQWPSNQRLSIGPGPFHPLRFPAICNHP